jgi:hypothetical protein
VSKENVFTLQFNEQIVISSVEDLVKNIKGYIKGPSSPYKFELEIYDPDNLLATAVKNETRMLQATSNTTGITALQVRVFDVQAPLYGGGIEKLEVWFEDNSIIQDLAGNNLTVGKTSGNLKYTEYISDGEKASAESGGSGMKYTLMTMFSANMVLKLVLDSSAALMWSLIHVLQVFRYILMININMPAVIEILMEYLAVVIGEVDEVEEMMPDWFGTYVVNISDLTINMTLYERFEEHGYDSPFLALEFSKQMTILFGGFLLSLPVIFFVFKFMKRCKKLHNKMTEIWQSFWWNAPVRTFTELYIEICLAFFLNVLNIRFMSASGVICTTIMFLVGIFVVFWPFVILRIICMQPKYVRKVEFNDKYGTLTEDFFLDRTLYQKAYYPIFVFQRLLITAILVMMYEHPFIQIWLIFLIQFGMVIYVVKMRPFNSELQQVI